MYDSSTPVGSVTPISVATKSKTNSPQLGPKVLSVLEEFTQWRVNKKNPSERIPDVLWGKILALPELRGLQNGLKCSSIGGYKPSDKIRPWMISSLNYSIFLTQMYSAIK